MKKVAIGIAIAALLTGSLNAQRSTETLTLRQALLRAIAENPTAERQRSEVDYTRAQSRLIRTSILPSIDLYGSTTFNQDEVRFGEGEDAFTIVPQQDWNYKLALVQPLYAGGRELKAYRQSKLAIEDANQGLRAVEEMLLLQTAGDYLGVVQAQALVEVEQKNLELAERRKKQAENFLAAGEVTRLDVLRAETSVKSAQRRLAGASQMREAAESRLRIDLALDSDVEVAREEVALPALPPEEVLIERALAARPELQRAEILSRIAKLEVGKQRGRYLPTVFAEASTSAQKTTFPTDQNTALTINFSVPVFQSGEIGAYVATARERQKQAELAVEETRRQIREAVQLALVDLKTEATNLALAREQLQAAEAEYEQTFELYQAQEATSLDLDSAESSLAEARRAVATGEIERDLSELRVWYSTGSIQDVLMNEETK